MGWFICEGASILHSADFHVVLPFVVLFHFQIQISVRLQSPVESGVPGPACSPVLTSLLPSACSFILSRYPNCVIMWQPFKGLV